MCFSHFIRWNQRVQFIQWWVWCGHVVLSSGASNLALLYTCCLHLRSQCRGVCRSVPGCCVCLYGCVFYTDETSEVWSTKTTKWRWSWRLKIRHPVFKQLTASASAWVRKVPTSKAWTVNVSHTLFSFSYGLWCIFKFSFQNKNVAAKTSWRFLAL